MVLRRSNSHRRSKRQVLIPAVNIVVFGAGGVGKSALIKRFLFDYFDETYEPTIEDDHRRFIEHNSNLCDVTIFDMAGAYQFPAMRRHAIHHGHGFLLVYAVDDPHSLDEARRLFLEISMEKGAKKVPIVLVGNKSDRLNENSTRRRVSREEAISSAADWGASSILIPVETSAKTNNNVMDVFNLLLEQIETTSRGLLSDKQRVEGALIRKASWTKLKRSIWNKLTACFRANAMPKKHRLIQ